MLLTIITFILVLSLLVFVHELGHFFTARRFGIKAEEKKELSEDDKFRFIKELDEEVNKKNEELKQMREKKEQEIMTI